MPNRPFPQTKIIGVGLACHHMGRRRSMYLDIPSARRSSYSSYGGRRSGGSVLRRIGFTLLALVLVAIGAGIYQWTRGVPKESVNTTFASTVTSPGNAAKLPWPSEGQAAVAVAGGATLA